MKLIRLKIISSPSCAGFLNGLVVNFRNPYNLDPTSFSPICFLGQNGSGKSQVLQAIAEIFQTIYHKTCKNEERIDSSPNIQFEIEYVIKPHRKHHFRHIKITRKTSTTGINFSIHAAKLGMPMQEISINEPFVKELLPSKVIGYTSGENETLSFPFIVSKNGYALDVKARAFKEIKSPDTPNVKDTRMMLIDYGTSLEVLISNLIFASKAKSKELLQDLKINSLSSFRCYIQLNHWAAPRDGVRTTYELDQIIEKLVACSTTRKYDDKTKTYTLLFSLDDAMRVAFKTYWKSPIELYTSLRKLAMLNELVIPSAARSKFNSAINAREFTTRLPDPQDEAKVFRFESIKFTTNTTETIDYLSLSDGEHQLIQIFGVLCMIAEPNVLFLLDEPESHFNPHWRTKFVTKATQIATAKSNRGTGEISAHQDCIVTTHSPFIPCDLARDQVFILNKTKTRGHFKISIRNPEVQTYGSTFDSIIEDCFEVSPPMSMKAKSEIDKLMKCTNKSTLLNEIRKFGSSMEKTFIADRIRSLENA